MARKKILYIITKSNWGGAQRYVYDLATNLPNAKFEAVVAAGGSGPLFEKLRAAGIRAVAIPGLQRNVNVWRELVASFLLLRLFLREKPDVIHLNSSKVGALGGIFGRIVSLFGGRRARIVFTVHGWGFKEARALWQRALIWCASALASVFQDTVILLTARDLKSAKVFVPARKCVLIPNGIAPIEFAPREEARAFLAQKLGVDLPQGAIIGGTITEFTQNKGLEYLIEAIHLVASGASHPQFRVILIGEGEDRQRLEQRIHSLGLSHIVRCTGFIPDAKRYLKGLDFFLFPSLKEGLPYALMEAMAAGLPAIATGVGGIPDLIRHCASGILVPPKDPRKLADALMALLRDGDARAYFGTEAARALGIQFSLSRMLRRTVALYT